MTNHPGRDPWHDDEYDWNQFLDKDDLAGLFDDKNSNATDANEKKILRPIAERITKSARELIDEEFRKKIKLTENGVAKRATVYDAILAQVYAKALSHDRRALQVLILLSKFGQDRPRSSPRVTAEYVTADGRLMNEKRELL